MCHIYSVFSGSLWGHAGVFRAERLLRDLVSLTHLKTALPKPHGATNRSWHLRPGWLNSFAKFELIIIRGRGELLTAQLTVRP